MITDEQIKNAYILLYERGVLKREVRSYEVSLWTLLDEFITVLKWSDVEQKGRIENPKLILNIDGTEKFTFSIPMYYRVNNELVENPNWYTVKDGVLIKGLRKLKIIFNKSTSDEEVFELLITNVKDNHESDILSCEVEAEGLAFLELGKIGYKLNLSLENFELDYKEWQEKGEWKNYFGATSIHAPIATVDYWCQNACHLEPYLGPMQVLNPRKWYYSVEMKYNLIDNITGLIHETNRVYEDPYATNWDEDGDPLQMVASLEKARILSIENSNVYNITQEIAETFGIFCKYKYLYDANYHIIGRLIIFYNNFILEDYGTLAFTYPYSAKSTSRTIDSADVTTKLYVLSVDNDNILEGVNTIMNSKANRSREDYILNFDYLHDTGAITEEQYDKIEPYLNAVRECNDELINVLQTLDTYNTQITDLKAKQTVYKNSIDLDEELQLLNSALAVQLDSRDGDSDGYVELAGANCDYCVILTDSTTNKKYVDLKTTNKGIVLNTIHIYTNLVLNTLSGEITGFEVQTDEYNNAVAIYFTTAINKNVHNVFLTYKYSPKLYYDNIVTVWKIKLAKDTDAYNEVTRQIGPISATEEGYSLDPYPSGTTVADAYDMGLNKLINEAEALKKILLKLKDELVTEFELMMGPAIREGYWQPEDYLDYGDLHTYSDIITTNNLTTDTGYDAMIAWDSELFDDEDKLTYLVGIGLRVEYYPCIDLSAIFPNGIPNDLSEYSLVWKATPYTTDYGWNSLKDLTIFAVGSKALFKFIKVDSTYKPVLVITGAKTLSVSLLVRMIRDGSPRLEKYKTTVDSNGDITISHGSVTSTIATNLWLCYRLFDSAPTGWSTDDWQEYSSLYTLISSEEDACMAYPRIKISSTALKTDTDNLAVKYGNTLLTPYEDYYINIRNTLRDEVYHPEYFITIKPESIVKNTYSTSKNITVYYALSNADTAIYLDALKISKENAYPKVSYEVNVNTVNTELIHTLYNKLAQIIMINDAELKFENVFGYISGLELNLDKPWEDTVEVKNYSNKFEDLFSTIVATSEAMRLNEGLISSLFARGSWMNNFNKSANSINEYLDSYFKTSLTVKQRLTEIFTEAGEILSNSSDVLTKMRSLTLENADILHGFANSVTEKLTAKVYHSDIRPYEFKPGDIWILTDNGNEIARYVATYSSKEILGNRNILNDTAGFVRTYDGTLASITGASLNIDAEAGTINVEAENEIKIKSGKEVYIAADGAVKVVGNQAVTIGGGSINIAGSNRNKYGEAVEYSSGNINLVSSGFDFSDSSETSLERLIADAIASTNADISKVLISPKKIELGSSNIIMRGDTKILMSVSRGPDETTAAIELSANNGVWIGSGKSVRLFGGGFITLNQNTGEYENVSGGASIELNNKHLIFGYSNIENENATAIAMTDRYIIMAVGGSLNNNEWTADCDYSVGNVVIYNNDYYRCKSGHHSSSNWDSTKWDLLTVTGTTAGLIGARFTKDSIGFATIAANNTVNTILMNSVNGITIASGSVDVTLPTTSLRGLNLLATGGSYVRIAPGGIDISSSGYLYIDTNNFLLNSAAINGAPIMRLSTAVLTGSNTLLWKELFTINSISENTPIFKLNKILTNDNGIFTSLETALSFSLRDGLYVHGNIINDLMAFINGSYEINNTPYLSGIYLTNNSISGSPIYITIGSTKYYAWLYNGKTYYCADNDNRDEHRVGNNEVIYTYYAPLTAVAPKYPRKAVSYTVTGSNGDLYSYNVYYITTDASGLTIVKDDNNNDIRYDGSSSPTAAWYLSIPSNARSSYAYEYHSGNTQLTQATDLAPGTVLTRNLNITFSVNASSGLTTISTGQLGNVYISPDGLVGGKITGTELANTLIRDCVIDTYNTGYYGRCFYDYELDRNLGILKLIRIDGTTEIIDYGTTTNVITLGGSTSDTSISGNGSSSDSGNNCNGSCTGSCYYGCTGTCMKDCTGTCASGCLRTCQGSCTGSSSGCAGCANGCSGGCTSDCTGTCRNGNDGSSGSGSGGSSPCDGNCTAECNYTCSGGCKENCTTSCATNCYTGCSVSCTHACHNQCTTSCSMSSS